MPLTHNDYTVGCLCPMSVELAPVRALLDKEHSKLPTKSGDNNYILGEICGHNMVIAVLPQTGNSSAGIVATQLMIDFPLIRFGLLVGIGGGVPGERGQGDDIRLGDVVISTPTNDSGGVIQYDFGKYKAGGAFERTRVLNKPPERLLASVNSLRAVHAMEDSRVPQFMSEMLQRFPKMTKKYSYPGDENDQLFQANYPHQGEEGTCQNCDKERVIRREERDNTDPVFHYGAIGSANALVKDATVREELRRTLKIICVEMEAAGLMDSFPCLVIRGICDYADSHKNKIWQPYAAAAAAAYTKELLSVITPKEVAKVAVAADVVQTSVHFAPYQRYRSSYAMTDFLLEYCRGLNLIDAPNMPEDLFIGRDDELRKMETLFQPGSDSSIRKVLALGGMGGVGKTQLAIAYCKRYATSYFSVFWLNATSDTTLKLSLRRLGQRIFDPDKVDPLDDNSLWIDISNWLSTPDNNRWLLVYDNYDDPDQYDITKYYPSAVQGSVIITTRVPSKISGEKLEIRSMSKEEDGLRILSTRSGREHIESGNWAFASLRETCHSQKADFGARQLVKRLDGHPLALATAGVYLQKSSFDFCTYFIAYECRWETVASPEGPTEYSPRTLYNTWELSYARIKEENPEAAQFLGFLAYLDHRAIWYGLLCQGYAAQLEGAPAWFNNVVRYQSSFESAMQTLVKYSLAEGNHQTQSYNLHVCVHDWILNCLNRAIDVRQYWIASDCVAECLTSEDWDHLFDIRCQRLAIHAKHLANLRFKDVANRSDFSWRRIPDIFRHATLLRLQLEYFASELMYERALVEDQKSLGPGDHRSTLSILKGLGMLYLYQGRLAMAERMFIRVREGFRKILGSDDIQTLDMTESLGQVYRAQDKLRMAEETFLRVLAAKERIFGPGDMSSLTAAANLGNLYASQGKFKTAEEIFTRVVAERKKFYGPDHALTVWAVSTLGRLLHDQGKSEEAEQMYMQALAGYEKIHGPDHVQTLEVVRLLGDLYRDQNQFEIAEKRYLQALAAREKQPGPDDFSTLDIVHSLGTLYAEQGRPEAEKLHIRAQTGYKNAGGDKDRPILKIIDQFGLLYHNQVREEEFRDIWFQTHYGPPLT
ncbi:uncharacterized protein Z518_04994 [Rhinocladiella mackenziei CBS 650.93]|uniref:Nucleoside phosphorylase domain-containing protein n=1 Tax=Rhinocladiella mackenziei CBS 650.93 TaxID=1442369 RepID=A0A0D2H978_9EURO|nr:uncharacterized protein Z518_04994 [Rhinocladiella mackenziei CBS 650.93]KIX07018.1 hypothetical protein Z518_04994 [Rhinocladiella mackenziei CBS 650.93]